MCQQFLRGLLGQTYLHVKQHWILKYRYTSLFYILFYIHNLILQLNVLDEAAQHNPNAWWWLKADGCDINKGLKESSRLEWSGDVNLGDGLLQEQYKNYKNRLKSAEKIGLHGDDIAQELADVLVTLQKDLEFLQSGMCI